PGGEPCPCGPCLRPARPIWACLHPSPDTPAAVRMHFWLTPRPWVGPAYGPRVDVFDVLGDPVRRRLLELLAGAERSAGALASVVQAEFGITQPAVSQHPRVLRETGFVRV